MTNDCMITFLPTFCNTSLVQFSRSVLVIGNRIWYLSVFPRLITSGGCFFFSLPGTVLPGPFGLPSDLSTLLALTAPDAGEVSSSSFLFVPVEPEARRGVSVIFALPPSLFIRIDLGLDLSPSSFFLALTMPFGCDVVAEMPSLGFCEGIREITPDSNNSLPLGQDRRANTTLNDGCRELDFILPQRKFHDVDQRGVIRKR